MSLRLNGSTSGYSELEAPAIAGDQTFTLPGTGGTLVTTASAGKILQVKNTSKILYTSTEISAVASTSYTSGGFSTAITPTSSSSKILFLFNGVSYSTGGVVYRLFAAFRGSTNASGNLAILGGNDYTTTSLSWLDSPATTSETIYSVGIAGYTTSGTHYLIGAGTLTLLEVAQ